MKCCKYSLKAGRAGGYWFSEVVAAMSVLAGFVCIFLFSSLEKL